MIFGFTFFVPTYNMVVYECWFAVYVVLDMVSYECNFEKYGQCGWTQELTDTSDWLVESSTRIGINGPTMDHTTKTASGQYNYL